MPVGSSQAVELMREVADAGICPEIPEPFHGVGRWYAEFDQTSDVEVMRMLASGGHTAASPRPRA